MLEYVPFSFSERKKSQVTSVVFHVRVTMDIKGLSFNILGFFLNQGFSRRRSDPARWLSFDNSLGLNWFRGSHIFLLE
jgi:hypothetical protein